MDKQECEYQQNGKGAMRVVTVNGGSRQVILGPGQIRGMAPESA